MHFLQLVTTFEELTIEEMFMLTYFTLSSLFFIYHAFMSDVETSSNIYHCHFSYFTKKKFGVE